MTNEEKFCKGIIIYKTDDDVICELWSASTKHADAIYSMNTMVESGKFERCPLSESKDHDIYQWLLYVASIQMWKNTAKEIVKIASEEWF